MIVTLAPLTSIEPPQITKSRDSIEKHIRCMRQQGVNTESEELLRQKKKAEIARKVAELEKKKEEGLGPNTIGVINKVRTLIIIFLIAKVTWSFFKSYSKHIDKKHAASPNSQSIDL